jgi:nitrate reductase NapE component
MEGTQEKETARADASEVSPASEYPATVESLRRNGDRPSMRSRATLQRHFLVIGIGIALLVTLMIVIGGFSFLVWNAR